MTHGTGPGPIAEDGSAVDYYLVAPPDEASAALIHEVLPDGASVLDLGAGTGRVAKPLAALGHAVTAVDTSEEMLAHIPPTIRTVCAGIEELELGERFEGVLLMSYLVNYGDRDAFLPTCRRHVTRDGLVLIQREPTGWFDGGPKEWSRDGVDYRLRDIERVAPDAVRATMQYSSGERTWTHTFISRELHDDELPGVLAASGLAFDRFLSDDRSWVAARPLPES